MAKHLSYWDSFLPFVESNGLLRRSHIESVAKVKGILQLDNLNVDFKYEYKIFTLNSGNRYLIKTKFILFVESNRLLRRSHIGERRKSQNDSTIG